MAAPVSNQQALLEVTDLWLAFGGLQALQNLTFGVRSGQTKAIIGPNGAGKTTLFNCLSGVYRPDRGRIRWQGAELIGLRPHVLAQRGLVRTFQHLELFPALTVRDNLLIGRHPHLQTNPFQAWLRFGRRGLAFREETQARAHVRTLLQRLELDPYEQRIVSELPHGTQSRVALARALAAEPKLLLLDEPAAGLNEQERENLANLLLAWKADHDLTLLIIEHHLDWVLRLADEVLVLDFGQRLAEGPPQDILQHPDVVRAYLGGSLC